MPDDPTVPVTLAARLRAMPESERREILEHEHPLYAAHAESWRVALDALEGAGGFLDGSYLWRFPRERYEKFTERQAQARYHNYLSTLTEIYARHIIGQGVTREADGADGAALKAWWHDVDGNRNDLTTWFQRWLPAALACGHLGIFVDRLPIVPPGPTRADERRAGSDLVFLRAYQAPAIVDWRVDTNGELLAVKLAEPPPETDILSAPPEGDARRYLIWDKTGWARFDADGQLVDTQPDAFVPLNLVPLVLFRPQPSRQSTVTGIPLVPPSLLKAIYNRASEEDVVLRDQAFSLLTVALKAEATAEQIADVETHLGDVGTTAAIVVPGTASYITPDQQVAVTLSQHQERLIAELYRAAHIRYVRDTMDSESGEAIRLQLEELNAALVGLAEEMVRAETQIVRCWCAWQARTPDEADARFEALHLTIRYPRDFFLPELADELVSWAEAVKFGLGDTFVKRLKKRVVRRLDPDLSEQELAAIDTEIDALPSSMAAGASPSANALRASAAARLASFMAPEAMPQVAGNEAG